MLEELFLELTGKYTKDSSLCYSLWKEIQKNYSNNSRSYHTLTHLENLLKELTEAKKYIKDWDTILFTLFYHDAVYVPSRTDNEERSASLARERLQSIGYPALKMEKCALQILATKDHSRSRDDDTNFFNDADLSILGQNSKEYSDYCEQIQYEYSQYSDEEYRQGREKVVRYFLDMEDIYKTYYFGQKYEHPARINLIRELQRIS